MIAMSDITKYTLNSFLIMVKKLLIPSPYLMKSYSYGSSLDPRSTFSKRFLFVFVSEESLIPSFLSKRLCLSDSFAIFVFENHLTDLLQQSIAQTFSQGLKKGRILMMLKSLISFSRLISSITCFISCYDK